MPFAMMKPVWSTLRKNVVLVTSDSLILRAEQLLLGPEEPMGFLQTNPTGLYSKTAHTTMERDFDSSEDFTNFLSRTNSGEQLIDRNIDNENRENTDAQ